MRLTNEAYEALGGLTGAVAERAEQTVVSYLPEGEASLRWLFLQLVRPGEGTLDTRRRMTVESLAEPLQGMVSDLVGARLLVAGNDVVTGQQTLEIAHEALIRGWQRLQNWVEADRDFLVWRQRLTAALEGWQHAEKDPGGLLRGVPLAEAERWLKSRGEDLTNTEREFVEFSLKARESEELERSRARRRLIIQLLAGLLFFATVAAIASGVALQQARAADLERDEAITAYGAAEESRAEAEASQATAVEAQTALAEAEQARNEAIEAANNGPALIAAAEAEVAQTKADLEQAQSDMASAQAERDAAEAELAQAESAKTAAQQAASDANNQLTRLRGAVDQVCPGPTSFAEEIVEILQDEFEPSIQAAVIEQVMTQRC